MLPGKGPEGTTTSKSRSEMPVPQNPCFFLLALQTFVALPMGGGDHVEKSVRDASAQESLLFFKFYKHCWYSLGGGAGPHDHVEK